MKKYMTVFLLIAVFALVPSISFADNTVPSIQVSLLKYSPFPAEPGNYVTVTLKIENTGSVDANNVKLKFLPEYPF